MATIVVQDDKILRFLEVILDPEVAPERVAAFCDYLSFDIPDPEAWFNEQRLRAGAVYPSKVIMVEDERAMRAALPAADAVVIEGLQIGADDLVEGANLKLVQKFGIDTRNIDLDACSEAAVPVRTLRRRVNANVAEHAILLMLAVGRKLIETHAALDFGSLQALGYKPSKFDADHVAGANWARIAGLKSLFGATLGALGLGEIGREVAARASSMGMDVLYHQRSRLPEEIEAKYSATYVSYEDLLKRSDFISIHLPLTASTQGMLNANAFSQMKPGAIITNISRAHIIDRAALIGALDSGRLGGAGLDVHYEEPSKTDEPLKGYSNVVLSPHVAVAHRSHNLADTAELVENLVNALEE
ncbi:MAG: NAD(P)-dependent oxidoreductase [Pseudomonadota bacterium]|nr:NAD(P)-dependent oxidoreductase [Pseudomonadota bacterium]MEC8088242.1 NAD(P)-dependent oxidoreductase [Pseudomonadota bacterium]MEC8289872.1 NAD(P)-dependent oxidoreductase [Pseudomonadota bacterium]MEC8725671.1 NAD(P)-dependent oxidoreductase [Pseudomonadota bacterium]